MTQNFPDPSVIQVADGTYYAYATAGNGKNAQVASSPDFNTWTWIDTDPLPFTTLPSWIQSGTTAVWAPDVVLLTDGTYAMTYSAQLAGSTNPVLHCVGVATSTSPKGPFNPVGDNWTVCPSTEGGAIDSSYFRDDDGTLYLVFKVDGNSMGKDTPIRVRKVDQDGHTLLTDPVELIRNGQYDGGVTEAPALIKANGVYFLTFSSNAYNTDLYDISYAYGNSLTAGMTKSTSPLLVTGNDGLGAPGGATTIRTADGSTKMVFHGNKGGPGNAGADRLMYTGDITLSGNTISV